MIERTLRALILRSTWMQRLCRVYSSRTVSIRNLPPRIVVSCTKSHVHTWLGWVAFVGIPVEIPQRRLRGFFTGTMRPSCWRYRWINREPTRQPACFSRRAIFI